MDSFSVFFGLMKYLFSVLVVGLLGVAFVSAGRGCCSWHGGQNYCGSDGMRQCKDGTESPSCTCAYVAPVVKKAAVKKAVVKAATKKVVKKK